MKQRFGLPKDPWPVHRLDKVRVHSKSHSSHRVTAYSPLATAQKVPLTTIASIQDTTGALLLARSRLQAREFRVQFDERRIKKRYLALVRGGEDAFPDTRGSIRNVLMYDSDGWFKKVANEKSDVAKDASRRKGEEAGSPWKIREAVTHWELLGSSVRSVHFRPCLLTQVGLTLIFTPHSFPWPLVEESTSLAGKP